MSLTRENFPFSSIVKPTGAICNLNCSYCFFLSKDQLYPGSDPLMSEAALETYLSNFLGSHPDGEVTVAWQGGEPTMRGLDFFRLAVEVANRLARPSQTVRHTIHTLCVHSPECGRAIAVEHNGDVYSCDHFVEEDYLLGNIATSGFSEMLSSPFQRDFGKSKRTSLPTQCIECPVRWACHGGCPKDRFATTTAGEDELNYLCEGYFEFFSHASPAITTMAQLLDQGRAPAEIMDL